MRSDSFDIPQLRRALRPVRLGRRIEYHDRLGSTSDRVKALADQGAPEGAVVIADEQTAGRGRCGNAWHSPPGCGIWMSVLLRPSLKAAGLAPLTLCAGYAAARAVEQVAGLSTRIKWPNDMLINDRKTAGILTEATTDRARGLQVVLGIGINVNHTPDDFPPHLRAAATSLRIERGAPVSRQRLLHALIERLDRVYDRFLRDGLACCLSGLQSRLAWVGDAVAIAGDAAGVQGVIAGIGRDGGLLIETPDRRVVSVQSGTIQRTRLP